MNEWSLLTLLLGMILGWAFGMFFGSIKWASAAHDNRTIKFGGRLYKVDWADGKGPLKPWI